MRYAASATLTPSASTRIEIALTSLQSELWDDTTWPIVRSSSQKSSQGADKGASTERGGQSSVDMCIQRLGLRILVSVRVILAQAEHAYLSLKVNWLMDTSTRSSASFTSAGPARATSRLSLGLNTPTPSLTENPESVGLIQFLVQYSSSLGEFGLAIASGEQAAGRRATNRAIPVHVRPCI